MFTIGDLIDQVEVQGIVRINKIQGDDIIPVYETGDGLYYTNETEKFMNKEIKYMYASTIGLVIEYEED